MDFGSTKNGFRFCPDGSLRKGCDHAKIGLFPWESTGGGLDISWPDVLFWRIIRINHEVISGKYIFNILII